jgi:DNA-binding transcriptional regulator GbsR (MarR family)
LAPTAFEADIVAVFADLVTLLGLPKSMGEIYGLIFASPEPLAFTDIERKLQLSKGTVSQGLRSLRELGAIQGVGEEGERREKWVATVELRQLIGTILRDRLVPYLERQDQRLAHAETELERDPVAADTAALATLRSRLGKLQKWQSRARTVLPVIGRML